MSRRIWPKGESGNPAGRPKGIRDKRTALRGLLEPHAKDLVKKVVAMALAGETTALRICLDRLIPPIKARDDAVALGSLDGSLADQGRAVLSAAADGRITLDQAVSFMQVLTAQARVVEVVELEARIKRLEEHANRRS